MAQQSGHQENIMFSKSVYLINKIIRRLVLAFLIGVAFGAQKAVLFFAALFVVDAIAGQIGKAFFMKLKKITQEHHIEAMILDSSLTYTQWKSLYDSKATFTKSVVNADIDISNKKNITVFTSGFMDPFCCSFHIKDGILVQSTLNENIKAYKESVEEQTK